MENVDYSKQLFLYDDRSKYDYVLKVHEVLFENKENILCKAVSWGIPEYDNILENETLLIDKKTGEVKNSEFYSWRVTSDEKWIAEQVQHMIEMNS